MRAGVRTGIEQMYARRSMTASGGESVSPACTGRNPCTPVDDDPASAIHSPSRIARIPNAFPVIRCLSASTRTARRGRLSQAETGRTLSRRLTPTTVPPLSSLWISFDGLSTVSTGLSTGMPYTYIWHRSTVITCTVQINAPGLNTCRLQLHRERGRTYVRRREYPYGCRYGYLQGTSVVVCNSCHRNSCIVQIVDGGIRVGVCFLPFPPDV